MRPRNDGEALHLHGVGTGITLSWVEMSDAAKYKVEHRQDGVQDWTTASDAVRGMSHTVSGLTCGVSYRFRVSAHGDGSADKEAWSDTPGELTPGAAFCNGALVFGSSSYSFI